MQSIVSMGDVAHRLGVRLDRLCEVADEISKDKWSHYSQFSLRSRKNPKTFRVITPPRDELKRIQKRIKQRIFDRFPLSSSSHGGVSGRSVDSNARVHLGKEWVVTVDIKGFFPSIRPAVVCRCFVRELGFGRDVARLLTRLVTVRNGVPQGAPTSTGVANLILCGLDAQIGVDAASIGVSYTRYLDDITFSGPWMGDLVNVLARALSRLRLTIHRSRAPWEPEAKLKITHAGRRQEVTGLGVNSVGSGPSVGARYRSELREAIFHAVAVPGVNGKREAIKSVRGKIAYVKRFNPGTARRLERYLARMDVGHQEHGCGARRKSIGSARQV